MVTNTLLNASVITKEALIILENDLVAAKKVRRDFEDRFGSKGAAANIGGKLGDTLNIRLPNKFRVRTTIALQNDNLVERSVALVVDKIAGADFTFSTKELTLNIDDFSERYIKPAVAAIANKIDFDVLGLYKGVYNQVGTPRTTPATFLALGAVAKRFNESAVPRDGQRYLCYDPAAELALSDAFKGFFHPGPQVTMGIEDLELRQIAGLKLDMDQNIAQHTTGSVTNSTPLANLASSTGFRAFVEGDTLISIDGLNGATVTAKQGDTFTIANVYAVNPQSRQSTGVLQQFVVTADTTAASSRFDVSSTPAYLNFLPAIYSTGPLQNVNSAPADNAAIVFFDPNSATSTQNLGFHKDAFALASVPLELPAGVHFAARESYKGISMRIVRQYDINSDIIPCRIDVLYGVKVIYPELAVRLAG